MNEPTTEISPVSFYVELFNKSCKNKKIHLDLPCDFDYIRNKTSAMSDTELNKFREPYSKAWVKDFSPYQHTIKAALDLVDKIISEKLQAKYGKRTISK